MAALIEPGAVTVAVIAKEPLPGRAKTRLCPPCSPAEAARVAEAALHDTLEAVTGANTRRRVLFLEGEPGSWMPTGFEVVPQVDGGLGARLDAVFAHVDGPGVVVGMDTPQLGARSVDAACRALTDGAADAVLGPAADGGYWTIGFRSHVDGAFDDVPMSRADTRVVQEARLASLGLQVAVVHELRDIDHWSDALAIAGEFPDLRTSAVVRSISGAAGDGVVDGSVADGR